MSKVTWIEACPITTCTFFGDHPDLHFLRRPSLFDEQACCRVAIHRTALTPEARKIDGEIQRLTLGPIGGAAIKLNQDADIEDALHIGEGIETKLVGMALGFRPAWAVGFAGAIRAFPVLDGVECLTILVDHDNPDRNGHQAGLEAARVCAQRWREAGREVLFVLPRRQGDDMADLMGGGHG